MRGRHALSAAEEVLLAAVRLCPDGVREFSEWDLTVEVWKDNKNRFGCRGYEDLYPDHKRVMMEVMGAAKDNPVRRGWMERTRPNHYRVTQLGLAQAQEIVSKRGLRPVNKAPTVLYDALERFLFHPVFRRYLSDPLEPKTWLGVAAFLGLTTYDRSHLESRLGAVRQAITLAKNWFQEHGEDTLTRGPSGGGKAIKREEVLSLERFLVVIQERFKSQLEAIKDRAHPGRHAQT